MAESRRQLNVVGIRFGLGGRVLYFDPGDMDLAVGDRVMVEDQDGPREALVVIAPSQVLYSELRGPLPPVLHKIEAVESE